MTNLQHKKRILFFGMPDMAYVCFDKLYRTGFNIVGVVPPAENHQSFFNFKSFLDRYNVNVISYYSSLKEERFLNEIKKLNADIAVVCSYCKLFPKELLECTKDGFLNCHPSLLPNYRGPNPYSHIILNGEKTSGVTIHLMDETFDTGDIIYQKEFDLKGDETMGILFNMTNYMFAQMLVEVLNHYEANGRLEGYPQKNLKGSYAPTIEPDSSESLIDWKQPTKQIDQFVRALNPFILAMTNFRDYGVRIMSTKVSNEITTFKSGIVCDIENGLGVATKDGILYIEALQFSSHIITTGKDFIKRFNVKIGETFY